MKKLLKYFILKLRFRKVDLAVNTKISLNTKLSLGVKIYEGCKIGSCSIGRHTYFSVNCDFTYTEIGSFCSVGPYVICGLGIHPTDFVSTYPGFYIKKPSVSYWFGSNHNVIEQKTTKIESDVWIGARVTIISGVHIGVGSILAAGSVITKDVPPYAIVGGVPAKVIKYRFSQEMIGKLLASKWWELDDYVLKKLSKFMNEPILFLTELNKIRK
tara:strand:- start:206 stop:847 length:642 start_codon:yes stop_codon:yes gene_type:complete